MAAEASIYRQLVESSLDGLWVVDPGGHTVYANPRVAELLGRTEAELAEMGVGEVLDAQDRAEFETHLADLATHCPDRRSVERTFLAADGTPIPLLVNEQALYDDEHNLVGYVHRLADDSRRRALVDELSRSQSQLARAQAIARIGSWEMRVDAPDEATCSDELYVVLDVDPEEYVPGFETFLNQLVEEDRAEVLESYARCVTDPGEQTVDVRARMRDGSLRWLRTVGQVLEWAPDGSAVRLGGTVQDVNDLKEAELKLLDAVDLNTIMQFIASAANETNTLDEALVRTRELLLAHPEWIRGVAFDVTAGGLAFRPIGADDVVLPTPVERDVAERVLADGDLVFEEDANPQHPLLGLPVNHDGQPIAVLVVTNISPFARHTMLRSMAVQVAAQLAQVVGRERAASELAAARDLAMAASTAKSDFLATMSHEIRTPLNGVIGLNDLLLRTDLDPHQRQLAEAMQGAGRSLLVLISDILDFSKIEAGGIELEAVAFRPAVVVQGTLELFAPMASTKGVELDVEIDDDVPGRLEGDPSRFGQVLSNLVANAVKFTHEGRVHVHVSASTVDRDTTLRVEVSDTGIGMDDEQLGRIFQPFRQADASTTRTFGGTGLGLAIANRLADALGGEVGVDSTLGKGSTFWFTGRFQVPAAATRPAKRVASTVAADRPGGHVLVVEDNEVNQLVAVGMLEVLGYSSEVVADGAAAAARAAGGRFDAVLMDLQMPRLDGFASTRLIRQAEAPGVRVPIIAVTASATAGEKERCLAAGMDGFIAKPIGAEALGRVMREHLAGEPPGPSVPSPPPPVQHDGIAPVLDATRLDELAAMGKAAIPLIQRAMDNFISGTSDALAALREAVDSADALAVRSAAHRLKGSAANLGALRVAELAFELEGRGETGALDGAACVVDDLASELDVAASVLEAYRFEPGTSEARSA